MVVYKYLEIRNTKIRSEFYEYEYKRNVVNPKVKLKVRRSKFGAYYQIHEGYHAYTVKNKFNGYLQFLPPFKCIIPKGTKYYIGDNDDIVAETIIIKRKVR